VHDAGTLTLTTDMVLVLGLVLFTVIMLVLEWLRADVVALVVLITLGITGLVPGDHVFGGFSSFGVMAIMAVMIMGVGLDRTGALNAVAGFIMRLSRGLESRLSLAINATATVMSSVIPSQALASLMIPVTSRISARTGVPMSRLLLPMAYVILTGTSTTLIGNSPLIMLNDLIASANRNLPPGADTIPQFGIFSVTPVGIILAITGVVFFAVFTRRLFRNAPDESRNVTPTRTESYFAETYNIRGDVYELIVTSESPLVGMSILEAERLHDAPLILAIKNGNEARLAPPADQMIWVGTVLGVMGTRNQVAAFSNQQLCRLSPRLRNLGDMFNAALAGISEAVVPPGSRFIKQSIGDLHLRRHYGISVLAVNRGEQVFRENLRAVNLRAGDTLVLHSSWNDLKSPRQDHDIVVVTDLPEEEARPGKIREALFFFFLAKGLALFSPLPLPVSLMVGAVGMLVTGVITPDEAYRGVNWKTIFIIACLIPLGWAMDTTGAATWLSQQLMQHIGGLPQWAIQAMIALITLAFSQVMMNVGAIVVMIPIAINVALSTGGNPIAYIMITAMAVSSTFLISSAHPALTMVAGPGGYRPRDFLRIGLPLTLVYLAVLIVAVNLIYAGP